MIPVFPAKYYEICPSDPFDPTFAPYDLPFVPNLLLFPCCSAVPTTTAAPVPSWQVHRGGS